MKQKSIFKNYIYNVTLTILNLLFPIITFPYVSRVLGADGIGKVNFVNSVASYFILFASLGIPTYGIREIARVRDSREKMSKVFCEIFTINFISTFICILLYFICLFSFKTFYAERLLYIVTGILILMNMFNIDWFYSGIEDYRFITIRSIIFKIISIIMLFVLVHSRDNYVLYAGITVIATSGSNIINVINSRRYITFNFKKLNFKKHMKSIIILFTTQFAISIYIYLDSIMTGIFAGNTSVGYYTTATKINKMSLGIITALSSVLLPRLSYYIKNNMKQQFDSLILKSIQIILFLGIPMSVGIYMLAPEITLMFAGKEFVPTILCLRITVPIILAISFGYFINVQVLMPLGKEKLAFRATVFGAIINFILNLMLIPHFKQNGTSIATSVTEICVTLNMIFYSFNYIKGKILNKQNIKYFIASIFIILIVTLTRKVFTNDLIIILISVILSCTIYFGVLLIIKDKIMSMIVCKFYKS